MRQMIRGFRMRAPLITHCWRTRRLESANLTPWMWIRLIKNSLKLSLAQFNAYGICDTYETSARWTKIRRAIETRDRERTSVYFEFSI